MDPNTIRLRLCSKVIPAPAALASAVSADPNLITSMVSGGTRSPADKISNYVYLNTAALNVGQKYCYVLGTTGDSGANRLLANGTQIPSRGYNSADSSYDNLTYANVQAGPGSMSGIAMMSSYGTFTYNPKLITAGDGSTATGHLIARNTYNCSDAGKGNGKVYVFDFDYFYNLCYIRGITFVDNNNNAP